MEIANALQSIQLPKIYKRENKNCYYDTYRKKLIEITPEETVRQKVAALFENVYGVPHDMILLEAPMSYYGSSATGRADIVIHAMDEDRQVMYPVAIIECKRPDIFLTDNVTEQAIRYCDILGGKYIIITNGINLEIAAYDEKTKNYIFLDEILSYEKMISEQYSLPKQIPEEFVRLTFDELKNQNIIAEYSNAGRWLYGASTNETLRSFAVNFFQCLLDTKHLLPTIKRDTFELIEDIGQRHMDYTNAGGGHYEGIYRAFLIKDRFAETQIVSMSIFGTDAHFRGENRNSYTSLIVSIDHFKTSHNSLQYNVDKFAELLPGGKIKFTHNGIISSYKKADVIEAVARYGSGLIVEDSTINLGKINSEKLLYLDDDDVSAFVYNLIEYALIREEVRKIKKSKK